MNHDIQLAAGMSAIDAACVGTENAPLIAAKCRGLLRGYHARWKDAGYLPTAVEVTLTAPLTNPATGRISRSFTLAGKLDVIADYGGRTYVFDHKLTGHDISDPNSSYWRQLVVESQPSHYMLLMWLNGQKSDGAVWDCVRRPMISPKKMSKAERASVVAEGHYFGSAVSHEDRAALAAGDERESLGMYEARLAHDCTVERPEWYFQRRAVPRIDRDLFEYATELWDIAQDVLTTRNSGRNYRSPEACMAWGSPCRYLGLCSGCDTPESDKWTRRTWAHPELPILEGDGKDVLTNSRLRTFRQCHRKHELQYEIGLERVDEEERESIFMGSAWHAGQESWWKALVDLPSSISQESSNGNCFDESPANSVGNESGGEATVAR